MKALWFEQVFVSAETPINFQIYGIIANFTSKLHPPLMFAISALFWLSLRDITGIYELDQAKNFLQRTSCLTGNTTILKTKRRRSDPVLWQMPLHQQKCQKGNVTTQKTPQKSSIKQQLRKTYIYHASNIMRMLCCLPSIFSGNDFRISYSLCPQRGKKPLASQFNLTYRYIDDVLSINNP